MDDQHPMSEKQKLKVWRIVGDERQPCRVEDLLVGDVFCREGSDEVLVVAQKPYRRMEGDDYVWITKGRPINAD